VTSTRPTGVPSGSGPQGRVRASDEDRTQATSLVSEHYAQGRLDDAELDRRTSGALGAVYLDELDGLLADLPGNPFARPGRSRSRTVVRAPIMNRSYVFGLLVFAVVLVVITRGAAIWFLLPLWWFVGPASRGHRSARWSGPAGAGPWSPWAVGAPVGRPALGGRTGGCHRW
jgi:hypothetical protein